MRKRLAKKISQNYVRGVCRWSQNQVVAAMNRWFWPRFVRETAE